MPVKAVLLSQLQTKHKNCAGFENLTNFNKAELLKADTNLVGANKDYVARAKKVVQVRKTKLTRKKVVKELKIKISDAKYKVMTDMADALARTQKSREALMTQFKSHVTGIKEARIAELKKSYNESRQRADDLIQKKNDKLFNDLIKYLDDKVEKGGS